MRIFFIVLLFGAHYLSYASDIPKFGNIQKSELELKFCDFEKDASAMILYKTNDVYLLDNSTIQDIKVRIKIFSDKAESYSNIKIKYDPEVEETIEDIKGTTYNLVDGKIIETVLKKDAIFNEDGIGGDNAKIFAMPAIKKGCVFEYKYRIKRRYSILFPSWYFQDKLPTLICRYTSLIPPAFQLRDRQFVNLPIEKEKNERGDGTELKYTMRKLPGLQDEIFMSSPYDYLQTIHFELVEFSSRNKQNYFFEPSWEKVLLSMKEGLIANYFYDLLDRRIFDDKNYYDSLELIKSPIEKLNFIYHYVRSNMTWNFSETFYSIRGLKHAWQNKKGSRGEINLILYNLLKQEGFKVYPILTSTKEAGGINKFYPTIRQFNTMITEIQIDNQIYYLDASSKKCPYTIIPPELNYTLGYKILPKSYEWVEIKSINRNYKNTSIILAELDEVNSALKGDIQFSSIDYARLRQSEILSLGKGKYIDSMIYLKNGLSIEDINLKNEENESNPLIQTLHFKQQLQKTDDYLFFNLNYIPEFNKNPLLTETRYSDIDFDYFQNYSSRGTISIPSTFKIESMPQNTTILMPDSSISAKRIITFDEGILSYKIDIEYNRLNYPLEAYAILKDFYKKMYDMLNENIVIKKL
jgi:hypothetical protein